MSVVGSRKEENNEARWRRYKGIVSEVCDGVE